MGKVTYSPGIEYVSGSLAKPKKQDGHNHGDYLIGTHRVAPTANPNCTRLYIRKGDTYVRTKFTAEERTRQTMFATAAAATRARLKNASTIQQDKAAFQAQSEFKSLYQFVFNDEYDKLRG